MANDDNESAMRGVSPLLSDASGRAALLLVESLIHGLCEKDILSAGEAIVIAERATDVQSELAEAADGAGALLWQAHSLLSAIVASLRTDGDRPKPPYAV